VLIAANYSSTMTNHSNLIHHVNTPDNLVWASYENKQLK